MGISDRMKSLCEEIITAHEDRKRHIKDLEEQAQAIRDDARKYLKDIRSDLKKASKAWNEMSEILKAKMTKSK